MPSSASRLRITKPQRLEGWISVRAVFTSELIRTWQNVGNPSPVPVFIVGMARSGSTLVEQILASHPQVFGGGELKHFPFDGAVKGSPNEVRRCGDLSGAGVGYDRRRFS